MPTAHLIYGYLGAGKTTFAKQLERETGAVRFSPDEWLSALFGSDPPAGTFDDSLRRVYGIVDGLWPRVLRAGADVILDCSFWERARRDEARRRAAQLWSETRLYHVFCREETARQRCRQRNLDLQGSLLISDETFDALRVRLEPLGPDEPYIAVDTEGGPLR